MAAFLIAALPLQQVDAVSYRQQFEDLSNIDSQGDVRRQFHRALQIQAEEREKTSRLDNCHLDIHIARDKGESTLSERQRLIKDCAAAAYNPY